MKRLDSFDDSFRTVDRNEYIEVKKEEAVKASTTSTTVKNENINDVSQTKNVQ